MICWLVILSGPAFCGIVSKGDSIIYEPMVDSLGSSLELQFCAIAHICISQAQGLMATLATIPTTKPQKPFGIRGYAFLSIP